MRPVRGVDGHAGGIRRERPSQPVAVGIAGARGVEIRVARLRHGGWHGGDLRRAIDAAHGDRPRLRGGGLGRIGGFDRHHIVAELIERRIPAQRTGPGIERKAPRRRDEPPSHVVAIRVGRPQVIHVRLAGSRLERRIREDLRRLIVNGRADHERERLIGGSVAPVGSPNR